MVVVGRKRGGCTACTAAVEEAVIGLDLHLFLTSASDQTGPVGVYSHSRPFGYKVHFVDGVSHLDLLTTIPKVLGSWVLALSVYNYLLSNIVFRLAKSYQLDICPLLQVQQQRLLPLILVRGPEL